MKTEIFEMKSSKWQKLSEKEILHKDWSNYHFINLLNEDCISLKGIGIYMKSKPMKSLDKQFENDRWNSKEFLYEVFENDPF